MVVSSALEPDFSGFFILASPLLAKSKFPHREASISCLLPWSVVKINGRKNCLELGEDG